LVQNDPSRFLDEMPEDCLDKTYAGGGARNMGLNNMGSAFERMQRPAFPSNQNRPSAAQQAEKQYGMPIAQIRQKYRGIPLDQLVKKESLYKKLLKALRG
jgi:DNA helicase-2/ATP-dependent DNA helicase PcrA